MVPKTHKYLFILEPQKEDFLHHSEFGELFALLAFLHVPWVERNAVVRVLLVDGIDALVPVIDSRRVPAREGVLVRQVWP